MKNIPHKNISLSFLKKKHLIYPAIVALLFILLVSLKISGTSIGIYHDFLYGDTKRDPDLILGHPQAIRSDEWLVATQLAISQQKNNYERINPNINHGIDMSVVVDAPYRDWSTVFKPQNLSFFILPFEYAFAFKWWLLLAALLLSAYYFVLRITDKISISILLSIIIGFSPFVFWWYQTGTILPIVYGFLILLTSMAIIHSRPINLPSSRELPIRISQLVRALLLTYLLACFAIVLYPPFQIPIAIVCFLFLLGYLVANKPINTRAWIAVILPVVSALVLTAGIVGGYLVTRLDAVHAFTDTVYPGERIVTTGGYDIKKLLVTYLQPQLQSEENGGKYTKNQSEDSSFILHPIFLLIPSVIIFISLYTQRKRIDYLFLSLIICSILFVIQLFLPGADMVTRILFLHLVPHDRLLIGLGFLSILLTAYIVKLYNSDTFRLPTYAIYGMVLYCIAYFIAMLWAGFETHKLYPDFIASKKLLLLFALIVATGLALFLVNKKRVGLLILAGFSLVCVYQIHPLYRGIGVAYENDVYKSIQTISTPNSTWAAAQSVVIENFPQMFGQKSVTGVLAYPNTKFWSIYSGEENDRIYNRYAHTFLTSNDTSSLILVGPDLYAISSACYRKVAQKVDYVLSTTPLSGSCYELLKTVPYPNMTFYIYKQ